MAKKAKPRKPRVKSSTKRRPAKKVSAKRRSTKKISTKRPAKTLAKKRAGKARSGIGPGKLIVATAVVSGGVDAARDKVRRALRACMRLKTTHGDFGWEQGPGTWEMDNPAWKRVLRCVCQKIRIPLTASLIEDTISLSFEAMVDILAGEMVGHGPGVTAATAPSGMDAAREDVRDALRECMKQLTTHGDFDWDQGPGTWEMENSAWKRVLRCVCKKLGIPLTASLIEDTIGLSFGAMVDILAGEMVG